MRLRPTPTRPARATALLRARARQVAIALGTAIAAAGVLVPSACAAPAVAATSATPAEVGEIQRLQLTEQHARALALIDQALARDPKDAAMRFRRGVSLARLGREPEAIAVFQQLVDAYPTVLPPYQNLAALHAGRGDWHQARAVLERAVRMDPGHAPSWEALGEVEAQLARQAWQRARQAGDAKMAAAVKPRLALLDELLGPSKPAR